MKFRLLENGSFLVEGEQEIKMHELIGLYGSDIFNVLCNSYIFNGVEVDIDIKTNQEMTQEDINEYVKSLRGKI